MEKLKDKDNIHQNKLSILITQDGFSFCVLSTTNSIVHFQEVKILKSTHYPKDLMLKFQEVIHANFAKDNFIKTVELVYENDSFSLVPSLLFDEHKKSHYIKYNAPILANDFFAHDQIETLGVTNVFIPYIHINNYLHELFGEFEYQHHLSVLLYRLYNKQLNTTNCFCIVTSNYVNLVCFDNARLVLCNAYAYNSIEDVAYHLLFALEQLNLNREEMNLYLSQKSEKEKLLEYISPYIKHIKSFTLSDFANYTTTGNEDFQTKNMDEILLLNL